MGKSRVSKTFCSWIPFGHLSIRSCTPKIFSCFSIMKNSLYKPKTSDHKKRTSPQFGGDFVPNLIEDLGKKKRSPQFVSTRPPYNLSFGCNVPFKKSKCTPVWENLVFSLDYFWFSSLIVALNFTCLKLIAAD